MANAESKDGEWIDLGIYKSINCKKVNGRNICELKFTGGRLTIAKDVLKESCRRAK